MASTGAISRAGRAVGVDVRPAAGSDADDEAPVARCSSGLARNGVVMVLAAMVTCAILVTYQAAAVGPVAAGFSAHTVALRESIGALQSPAAASASSTVKSTGTRTPASTATSSATRPASASPSVESTGTGTAAVTASNSGAPVAAVAARPKKRLFFAFSPGNSGTAFLARLLLCASVKADHEAQPAYLDFRTNVWKGRKQNYDMRRSQKLPAFLARVNATGDEPYADIAQLFYKTEGDVILDYLLEHQRRLAGDATASRAPVTSVLEDIDDRDYEVDIIVQRRYMPHQLRSVLVREVFQYNETEYPRYMGTEYNAAFSPFGIIRPPPGRYYNNTDPIDKAIGYLIDVEEQLAWWKETYPPTAPDTDRATPRSAVPPVAAETVATAPNGVQYRVVPGPLSIRYHHTMLEEVSTEAGAERMLREQLGLPALDLQPCARYLFNSPPANPHAWLFKPLQSVPEPVWRARIQRFLQEYAAAGIPLPQLPQLARMLPCDKPEQQGAALDAHTLDSSKDGKIRDIVTPLCPVPYVPYSEEELQAILFNVTIPMRPLTRRYIGVTGTKVPGEK